MDNSVIVLDSSEDEVGDSPEKRISKKMLSKPQPHFQKLNEQKMMSSSKSLIITKINTQSAVKSLKYAPSNIPCTVISSTVTKNNNNMDYSIRQKENNHSKKVEDIYFKNKIESGEITLLPIGSPSAATTSPISSPIKTVISTIRIDEQITSQTTILKQPKPIRRITPIKIADVVSLNVNSLRNSNKDIDSDGLSKDSFSTSDANMLSPNNEDSGSAPPPEKKSKLMEKTPINESFTMLIDACKAADKSDDMEKLINKKMIKYYQSVHPDFVNSKSFCKNIRAVADAIKAQPDLVYLKINGILEELNTRRKCGETVVVNDQIASTGNKRKDTQIRKLNKALYFLKKKIAELDEAEVNWDDEDNSQFMICERYKKRACEIYEKICDITGESKNAQRLVKKPIKFHDTSYAEFNRTLQTFVNETKTFPDMFDVLRCLEHCNLQYGYRLNKEECKKIAQDAFIKIGKLLQKRRKTDLYEMVSYFTGEGKDPAAEDATLQSKLSENQKYHKQINDLIDKYAQQQDKSSFPLDTSGSGTEKLHCSDNKHINIIKEFSVSINHKEIIETSSKQIIEILDDGTNNDVRIVKSANKPNAIAQLISGTKQTSSDKQNNNKTVNSDDVNSFKLSDGPAIVSVTTLNFTEINSIIEDNKIIISDDEDL